MIIYDENIFRDICKNSASMVRAAAKLGIHFNTFKRIAIKLNCYTPNIGLKGTKKPKRDSGKYITDDILNNKHSGYSTYKLKNRLFQEGIKENKCEVCGITQWNNRPISMELDHIDGNRNNHNLNNLRIICPNCHSQTVTYRSKNRNINKNVCQIIGSVDQRQSQGT